MPISNAPELELESGQSGPKIAAFGANQHSCP
jgi:hypothetical protein